MATKQISVKVYYLDSGVDKEIRKFTLDPDVATNYEYLMGRIKVFFTSLLRKDLQLYWKDGENDFISVSSDSELMEVMNGIPHDCDKEYIKLYIQVKSNSLFRTSNVHHSGIVCDGCNRPINGFRYKCTVCPDFDLCSTCERNPNKHAIDHDMLCIKKPCFRMGGSRRCNPWSSWSPMDQSHFYSNRGFCQFKKTPCPEDKQSEPNATGGECKEFIEQLASVFGLAPDVAVSQTQSFFDHLHSQSTSECDAKHEEEVDPEQMKNNVGHMFGMEPECLKGMGHMFGMNPECLKGMFKHVFEQGCRTDLPKEEKSSPCEYRESDKGSLDDNNEVNMEHTHVESDKGSLDVSNEVNMEHTHVESDKGSLDANDEANMEHTPVAEGEQTTASSSHPTSSNSNVDLLGAASPLFNQTGVGSGLPEEQLKNFGNVIGDVIQNIGSHFNSLHSNYNEKKEFTDHKKKTYGVDEDFVSVENKDKITEAEAFDRRLGEAVLQMEAMGFVNDCDWLTRLLVAKNLDISQVLDALNPPKA